MKKILLKLALLGATLFAYQAAKAQTVSVTADLKTMFNAGAATKTQVCFSLTDGNGNQLSNPRTSSGVIVPTATQCVLPDGSGHVSTTVIANDQITPSNSIYSVTYTFNGRVVHGDIFQFALADGTENLNTKLSLSTIPVVLPPTGDTTYARLDGSNLPFTAPVNTTVGYRINGIALLSHVLRGNGTNYVDAVLSAADLSDGNSGTGAIAHVISPAFTAPSLGAATATSLTATSSSPFSVLSGSTGTNMTASFGRASTEVNLAIPSANGFFFTNADLAGGDLVIRNLDSARRIYIGAGTANAPVAITNTGISLYTTSGTLPAQIQNDGGGNIQIGSAGTGAALTVGQNPFSAFSINPGTALVSNPTAGQARRGMTYGTDPAGDITIWYNSAQTGAGIFFKDGNTAAIMAVPTGAGQLVSRTTTDTLTNKRVTQRVVTVSNSTTLTPDGDNSDVSLQVNTQAAGTLTVAAPSGTPTDGQKLIIRVKSTNAQTYSFNATYRFSTTTAAPTTLAAGKTDYIGALWNATDSKWDVVAVDQGH
jgi:hypothetical protein